MHVPHKSREAREARERIHWIKKELERYRLEFEFKRRWSTRCPVEGPLAYQEKGNVPGRIVPERMECRAYQ